MKYELCKEVMHDAAKRTAFNELAKATFHLSFEKWYQDGDWKETNIPYTLFDGEKAVANISVNTMDVLWQGRTRKYIQLGTVMTDREYRHQGLSRFLMEEVMKDWEDKCEEMFLFANKKVLEFYPKFGFVKEHQYQYTYEPEAETATATKLNMTDAKDIEFLKSYYAKTNPFSKLQAVNNESLLMFYCRSFMKDCVYYVEEQDAVVIAEQEGNELVCYDVYCDEGKDLRAILSAVAAQETNKVSLMFTPEDMGDYQVTSIDDQDNTLFVLKGKENIFAHEKLLFPEISHT